MSMNGQGTKWHRNIAEILTGWVWCTNVADDRQTDRETDDRRTGDSIIANSSRSLKSEAVKISYSAVRKNLSQF